MAQAQWPSTQHSALARLFHSLPLSFLPWPERKEMEEKKEELMCSLAVGLIDAHSLRNQFNLLAS